MLFRNAIERANIDNKSVENAVCVLRNLSYRAQEVQGEQLYMAVLSWYFVKCDFSRVRYCTVYNIASLYTRCQKSTAMFIWSGCNTNGLFLH